MPTRTRQQSLVLGPSSAKTTYRNVQRTFGSGPQGLGYPLTVGDTIELDSSAVRQGSVLDVIADTVGRKAFNNCEHTARRRDAQLILKDAVEFAHWTLDATEGERFFISSYFDLLHLPGAILDSKFPTLPSPSNQAVPMNVFSSFPDRRTELAPKAMKRIQTLRLAITILEAKEFPTLLKWIKTTGRKPDKAIERVAHVLWRNYIKWRYKSTRGLSRKGKLAWYAKYGRKVFADFVKEVKHNLNNVPEAYLGYMYALTPTVGEIAAIIEELKRKRKPIMKRFIVKAGSSIQNKTADPSEPLHDDWYYYRAFSSYENVAEQYDRLSVDLTRRYQYRTDFFNTAQAFVDRYVGLNPAADAWAVMPVSFLVDVFFQVDKVVDQLWLENQETIDLVWWRTRKCKLHSEKWIEYPTGIVGKPSLQGKVPVNNSYRLDHVEQVRSKSDPVVDSLEYYDRIQTSAPDLREHIRKGLFAGLPKPSVAFSTLLIKLGLNKSSPKLRG